MALDGGSPLRRARAPEPGNLPAQLTSFVGRERELAEVVELLRGTRLLTLTGAGRLGQDAPGAAGRRPRSPASYPDGAWWVELAPLADGAAGGAGASPPRSACASSRVRGLDGAVADHLRARRALLVLDNCEHLVEAVRRARRHARCARCPRLTRAGDQPRAAARGRRDRLAGAVAAAPVPSRCGRRSSRARPSRRCGSSSSARRGRGRASRLTDANAAARSPRSAARLDGMPLAIELAAARVRCCRSQQIADAAR